VPLVELGGVVYGGTKNGEVFAVDVTSRKLLWRYKITNSSINKLQFMSGKRLLVNSMDGKIVAFKICNF
jgi:outer membrane protein assembly factor BamB